MEHDRDSETVTAMGNRLYARLKEAGITTPSNFSGYSLARELLLVARRGGGGWDGQKVALVAGWAFIVGLSIGLVF